jgi:hypothetical protein
VLFNVLCGYDTEGSELATVVAGSS